MSEGHAPSLILASRSPRRAALLGEAGFAFEQRQPRFDDPPQPAHADDPAALAIDLAAKKARSLAKELRGERGATRQGAQPGGDGRVPRGDAIILAADTICVGVDRSLIGQPADAGDAFAMIRGFCNATHDVVTGVALLRVEANVDHAGDDDLTAAANDDDDATVITFADTVPVTFGELSDSQIDEYVTSGEWRGKAGGYNLFDRQRAGWAVTVPPSADPSTVVGLPMRQLTRRLRGLGVEPAPQDATI